MSMYTHAEMWFSFSLVVLIQFAFLIVNARFYKRKPEINKLVIRGLLSGVPFGIAFDLIFGKLLNVYDYYLGFGVVFLILNGLFSYGLMIVNTMLLKDRKFFQVYFWAILYSFACGVANTFYPVWIWNFPSPVNRNLILIFAAYFGLTLIMMIYTRIIFKVKYRMLDYK